MRWIAAKILEFTGACVLVLSLLSGLGLNSQGEPSMARQLILFAFGAVILVIGITIECIRATHSSTGKSSAEDLR